MEYIFRNRNLLVRLFRFIQKRSGSAAFEMNERNPALRPRQEKVVPGTIVEEKDNEEIRAQHSAGDDDVDGSPCRNHRRIHGPF
ncbi:hypothetical protein LJR010_004453 [Ensifer adhaerens]|uniref:hypothetical protein n=1 Tax=Ensifer adhaerens TaxID=106592 RepID=UPI00399B9023